MKAMTQLDLEALRSALTWYGEQARLCRLIHSGGDAGRQALANDGGKRAAAALASPAPVEAPGSVVERVAMAIHLLAHGKEPLCEDCKDYARAALSATVEEKP